MMRDWCARRLFVTRVIRNHKAITDLDDALGALGNVRLVGDHHDGHAGLLVQLLQQREDLLGHAAVEVAGRLVGEEHAAGS